MAIHYQVDVLGNHNDVQGFFRTILTLSNDWVAAPLLAASRAVGKDDSERYYTIRFAAATGVLISPEHIRTLCHSARCQFRNCEITASDR